MKKKNNCNQSHKSTQIIYMVQQFKPISRARQSKIFTMKKYKITKCHINLHFYLKSQNNPKLIFSFLSSHLDIKNGDTYK